MGLFADTKDTVPRELYDALQGRYDALLDKYHGLRMHGATIPPEPKAGRVVTPGPTPEEAAAKRMHDELVNDLAREIESMQGVPKDVARAEAQRLRTLALGGGPSDPPI